MSFFDDIEQHLSDSLTFGTKAYQLNETERERAEEEEIEHEEWRQNMETDLNEFDDYTDTDLGGDFDGDYLDGDDDTEDANEEDVSTGFNIPINLSFSFSKPTRQKLGTGFWKYHDPSWHSWYFVKALLDNFPELRKNYDYETDLRAQHILEETYGIDRKRALLYFEWI